MKSSLTNNTLVTAIIDIALDKGAYNKYREHTTILATNTLQIVI